MAGHNFAGELTSDGLRFALAASEDDAAIRRLLRDNPMRGEVSISLEREPNYFHGTNVAGAQDQTMLVFSKDQLVCMGKCAYRLAWINGKIQPVGYLGELRLSDSAKGRFDILRRGFGFFCQIRKQEPATLCFTSIAADNHRARRLLEKCGLGFPNYQFHAEFVTLIVSVPRRPKLGKLRLEVASAENAEAVVSILNEQASRNQLATAWTVEMLHSLNRHGLPLDHIYLLQDRDKILGCGALWDQQSYRQTKIHSYAGALGDGLPLFNIARWFQGLPSLPKVGSNLKQAFVSPLGFTLGSASLLPEFLGSLLTPAAARGVEFLTIGLAATDERLPGLRKQFSTRSYVSRLYTVSWPGEAVSIFSEAGGSFLPDVALL